MRSPAGGYISFLNFLKLETNGETIPGIKFISLLKKANAAGGCRAVSSEGGIA